MRAVNSLDELKMPIKHKVYLEHLLEYIKSYSKVEKVLLFGSCARGVATSQSDIDLYILGSDITDEDEWIIAWNCPKWDDIDYIPCDLLSGTHDSFEKMSKVPGMIQCAVEIMGVDISGLL
jgi:predicted nucleotidyltransferase